MFRKPCLFRASNLSSRWQASIVKEREKKKMTSPFTISDILEGSVGILNNYNLCHIKTIAWDEIITGQTSKYLYVYKFQEKERDCTPCHESCEKGCWGEGPNNCQKFSKINCSPQCHQGRCFGSQPRECCHLFCAGGCTGPEQSDCLGPVHPPAQNK